MPNRIGDFEIQRNDPQPAVRSGQLGEQVVKRAAGSETLERAFELRHPFPVLPEFAVDLIVFVLHEPVAKLHSSYVTPRMAAIASRIQSVRARSRRCRLNGARYSPGRWFFMSRNG